MKIKEKTSWYFEDFKTERTESIKDNKSDDNEKLLKYKQIFDELSNERIGEIYNASKQIYFNNLTYKFKYENLDQLNVHCVFIINKKW